MIKGLFPLPIGIYKNSDISEHNNLLNSIFEFHPEYSMSLSKDKYILNSINNSIIYRFIQESLLDYQKNALGLDNALRFTQSWLTKHEQMPQYTLPHIHINSIVSGAYYIKADEQAQGITFYKESIAPNKYIKWDNNTGIQNEFLWNEYTEKVEEGTLILFPSYLKHAVIGSIQETTRCALAFNTWFCKAIGQDAYLSRVNF